MVAGRHVGGAALVGGLFLPGSPTYAQEPATNVPTTRAEAIAEARDEKVAELWPERTSMQWYTKFESSPDIDYYGLGNSSPKEAHTSYAYDDLTSDFAVSCSR